ncbi:hypothetical protein LCGC14_1424120 [marine sediment metagenome]|uniref:Uncharacterized protein n=1 Tax=marine sediment metagenome TaxID=412755 RepID=A0A0F9KBK0_9ZZZZ
MTLTEWLDAAPTPRHAWEAKDTLRALTRRWYQDEEMAELVGEVLDVWDESAEWGPDPDDEHPREQGYEVPLLPPVKP